MPRKPRIFLHHWRAKLASLAVAVILWLVIKHGMAYPPAPIPSAASPPPVVSAPTQS